MRTRRLRLAASFALLATLAAPIAQAQEDRFVYQRLESMPRRHGDEEMDRVRPDVDAGDHAGTRRERRHDRLGRSSVDRPWSLGRGLDRVGRQEVSRFSCWTGRDRRRQVEGTSAVAAWPASLRAWFMSSRCSSSSLRASSRAFSASSIERRICSRRSLSIF